MKPERTPTISVTPTPGSAMPSTQKPLKKPAPPKDPSLFCPTCSSELESLKCKLFCEKCGYYMSCSDYY